MQSSTQQYSDTINRAIADSCQQSTRDLQSQNEAIQKVSSAFCTILQRGGKRLRGSLVLHAYQSVGGKDQSVALKAALAIEMLHTYLLIIDDIQDNSDTRRGGPSAHVLLAKKGDTHQGIALAINAALFGAHKAQDILSQLNVPARQRVKIIELVNKTLVITAHGQTSDLANQAKTSVSNTQVYKTMQQKTAHYSFALPLKVGILLAGKSPSNYSFIEKYSLHLGVAFQLANDIGGVFKGADSSDLAEGKHTLLINHALKHATKNDQLYLKKQLGKGKLTQAELQKCRNILRACSALKQAQNTVESEIVQAKKSVEQSSWPKLHQQFLAGLAEHILTGVHKPPL